MIVGMGSDLVDIRRIERSIERFGDRFLTRVFTEDERSLCDGRGDRVGAYAKRFAAKEACSKALGTGIQESVYWHHMEVRTASGGKPSMVLTDGAMSAAQALAPDSSDIRVHVTTTDEYPYAQAFVVIEAV
ncbi:holo-ACP synthase [Coralliovum pocilloporae]|uniref:holo-ACP synthase n=1 Tax=Coralliovum pocilloporae TaxID=3066369 RepID=UPI00330722B5